LFHHKNKRKSKGGIEDDDDADISSPTNSSGGENGGLNRSGPTDHSGGGDSKASTSSERRRMVSSSEDSPQSPPSHSVASTRTSTQSRINMNVFKQKYWQECERTKELEERVKMLERRGGERRQQRAAAMPRTVTTSTMSLSSSGRVPTASVSPGPNANKTAQRGVGGPSSVHVTVKSTSGGRGSASEQAGASARSTTPSAPTSAVPIPTNKKQMTKGEKTRQSRQLKKQVGFSVRACCVKLTGDLFRSQAKENDSWRHRLVALYVRLCSHTCLMSHVSLRTTTRVTTVRTRLAVRHLR
jgi:hypothetical protein